MPVIGRIQLLVVVGLSAIFLHDLTIGLGNFQLLESTLRHWLHSPLQHVDLLEGQKEHLSPICSDGVLDSITYSWE